MFLFLVYFSNLSWLHCWIFFLGYEGLFTDLGVGLGVTLGVGLLSGSVVSSSLSSSCWLSSSGNKETESSGWRSRSISLLKII